MILLNLLNNPGNPDNPMNHGGHLNLFRISKFEFRIYCPYHSGIYDMQKLQALPQLT